MNNAFPVCQGRTNELSMAYALDGGTVIVPANFFGVTTIFTAIRSFAGSFLLPHRRREGVFPVLFCQ